MVQSKPSSPKGKRSYHQVVNQKNCEYCGYFCRHEAKVCKSKVNLVIQPDEQVNYDLVVNKIGLEDGIQYY